MRLVPDQDPDEIARLFEKHVASMVPAGVAAKVTKIVGNKALIVSRESPAVKAMAASIEYAFGVKPVFTRDGGSIGAVISMQSGLGIDDILMLGWGDPDDALHRRTSTSAWRTSARARWRPLRCSTGSLRRKSRWPGRASLRRAPSGSPVAYAA